MEQQNKHSAVAKSLAIYSSLVLISLACIFFIMQIWRADISIPFEYGADSIMAGEWVKSIIDNGWYWNNPYIGMPEGNDLRDVPMTDNFNFLVIRIISLFVNDYAATMNIFYLLTFPFIVVASYYVFRKFSISPYLSFTGAFLFTFLEYHYVRGLGHIFLGAYYIIPLLVMVILRLFSGELDTIKNDNASPSLRFIGSINPRFIGSAAICLFASTWVYYAYFACIFLGVTGVIRSLWQKNIRPAVAAVILIMVVTGGVILNVSPSMVYQLRHGKNPAAVDRVFHEAEQHSLKISELLLPATGHRIKFFSDIKNQYDRETSYLYRFYTPKVAASLGIIGSIGFLFLIAFLMVYPKMNDRIKNSRNNLLFYLSILNMTALLMATVGGFNVFLAHIIRFKIRAYERLSVFIAFFSIFVLLILIQNFYNKYIKDKHLKVNRPQIINIFPQRILFYILMFLLLVAGLFDQAGIFSTPNYGMVKKAYLNDKKFIEQIERILPYGSMIFQLPYIPYPESPPLFKMYDYDHLRGYLHSTKLRWSYGAIKGRPTDSWQKDASSRPTREMIQEISSMGFKGIYIDRNGYKDRGEKIIGDIHNILRVEPIFNNDGTKLFFSTIR